MTCSRKMLMRSIQQLVTPFSWAWNIMFHLKCQNDLLIQSGTILKPEKHCANSGNFEIWFELPTQQKTAIVLTLPGLALKIFLKKHILSLLKIYSKPLSMTTKSPSGNM